jgi:DNA polymerase-3 subunit gamma/tau
VLSDVPPDEIAEYKRQAALRELIDLQRLFRIARLGDEELAHSSVPRMVLEMTMVRLATADPVLPVDEVLARLDEIERGLGRGAPASPRPTASSLAPPSPPRGNGEPLVVVAQTPPPPPPSAQPAGARWDELLEFVQRKKLGLYLSLSHARFLSGGPGSLLLGVAKEKFRNELASKATLSQLEDLVSEFYGAPTRIRVESVSDDALSAAQPAAASETIEHPTVKAAVEILGGAVREVRSRR